MRRIEPDRVAIYIRWSTEDQGQGHTLAIQGEACRHYCLSQRWAVQDRFVYIDDGWSGGSLERPALSRLRSDVAAGLVQAVVVYKLDRLSRNIKDIISLVLDEWEGRCAVRSTMEPIDTSSDTGKLTFTLLSSFADFERGAIRARTLSGKKKNAEQGRNAGAPYPYGYERGDTAGSYRVIESEAAVIRLMFDLYLKGMGCKPIAEHLNRLGIGSRSGGPGRRRLSPGLWSNTAVARILGNPVYCGKLVYGRLARNARRGRDGERYYTRNESQSVISVASPFIPPIIDEETFRQVKQVRSAKQHPNFGRRAANSPHLLSGLLLCRCGHAMVGRRARAGSGSYYWCSGRKNKGANVCAGGMIRADVLDGVVLERFEAVYGSAVADITPARQESLARRRSTVMRLMDSARSELGEVERARRRLDLDYRQGAISGHAYQRLFDSLGAKELQLTRSLREWEQDLHDLDARGRPPADQDRGFISLGESFPALSDPQRKLLLRHLIHRIVAYRKEGSQQVELQIEWTGGA